MSQGHILSTLCWGINWKKKKLQSVKTFTLDINSSFTKKQYLMISSQYYPWYQVWFKKEKKKEKKKKKKRKKDKLDALLIHLDDNAESATENSDDQKPKIKW